jgi:hypothetical protein
MRTFLRQAAAITLLLTAVFGIIAITALKHALEQARLQIAPAYSRPLLNEYQPKTGDIIMVHYQGHGMMGIPVAEHWPTHAAIVWVRADRRVVVLECTKFSAPALPNVLTKTKDREHGVRAVPWAEYLNSVDNVMYIRQLTKGSFSDEIMQTVVEQWAPTIDFEKRVSESMTLDVTCAIGFVTVWPEFSKWCGRAAHLDEAHNRSTRSFCSEFVSKVLQKLGAIPPSFQDHYRMGPASFLQTTKVFDRLTQGSGYEWAEDRMIVRRF